jgi:subtilisin family serine protease
MPSLNPFARPLRLPLLAALALALAVPAVAPGSPAGRVAQIDGARDAGPGPSSYRAGQVVVRFSDRLDSDGRAATAHAAQAEIRSRLPVHGVRVLSLEPGVSVSAGVARLRSRPGVVWAEPNYVRRLHGLSNDPFLRELWGLHATGQLIGGFRTAAPNLDVDAPEAWDVTTGSSAVTVAVVDSGIAYNHPDLAPNLARNPGESGGGRESNGVDDDRNGFVDDFRGWDFLDDDNDPFDPSVGLSHGSLGASIVAARGGDGGGVAGVSHHARLLPLRVAGTDGMLTSADAATAYAYAARRGARIVNASFGGAGISQAELAAVRAAPSTLFVASAGNESLNTDASPVTPCVLDSPNVVCVAASDLDGSLADFSNFGARTVDLSAPGVAILGAQPPFADVFAEGFETDISARWVPDAGSTWERTSAARWRGSFSLADSPAGNYPDGADHAIRTADPVSLVGQSRCRLDYFLRLATELEHDGVIVEAATGSGGPWTELTSHSGSTGGLFAGFAADLQDFLGQAAVFVRFRFVSNATVTGAGAELDDVAIQCSSPGSVSGRDFAYGDGTSFSAPLVSGVAALALSVAPEISVATLRGALLRGVKPAAALAGRTVSGGNSSAIRTLMSIPAGAATGAASEVGRDSALISGTVQPHGIHASWRVQYGRTTAYGGLTEPMAAGNRLGDQAVKLRLRGLPRGTTVHYRVLASNGSGGTSAGADRSFRTAGSPKPGDDVAPRLRKLRVRRTEGGRISLAFTLSETARVTAALDRGRGAFKRVRARRLGRGKRALRLPRLKRGRYEIALVAADRAGNVDLRELRVRAGRARRGARAATAASVAGVAAFGRWSWPLGEGSVGYALPGTPAPADGSTPAVQKPLICLDPGDPCGPYSAEQVQQAVDEDFLYASRNDWTTPEGRFWYPVWGVVYDPKTGRLEMIHGNANQGAGTEAISVEGGVTFELIELQYFGKEKPVTIFGQDGDIVASAAGRAPRTPAAVRAVLRNEIAGFGLLDRANSRRDARPAMGAARRFARQGALMRRARQAFAARRLRAIRLSRADIQRVRRLVRERGLPDAHVRGLRRLGASDAYLAQLRRALTGTDVLRLAGQRFPAVLTNPKRLARERRFGRVLHALSP